MASYIPFANGNDDAVLVSEVFSDAAIVRVPIQRAAEFQKICKRCSLWVDAEFDGFHRPFDQVLDAKWHKHIAKFPRFMEMADEAFREKPDICVVEEYVSAALDQCAAVSPSAITVPQLPAVNDASRNRFNWTLAKATAAWKIKKKYSGRLVLPLVLTDQRQLNRKVERNKKISAAAKAYSLAGATGVWTVDSTLSDQAGSETFRKDRFPGLIAFHEELNESLEGCRFRVAGPYWGMNLVLWARGLVDFPAIGIGRAFQYHVSAGRIQAAKTRVAVPPLRRWAQTGAEFRKWLEASMKVMDQSSKAYAELKVLRDAHKMLQTGNAAKRQIAKFYKEWLDMIEAAAESARALALYQDFSSAYVLGNTLPELPAAEKTARRPERVAEYFMLSCL